MSDERIVGEDELYEYTDVPMVREPKLGPVLLLFLAIVATAAGAFMVGYASGLHSVEVPPCRPCPDVACGAVRI